jgi:hypothetical protein
MRALDVDPFTDVWVSMGERLPTIKAVMVATRGS